MKKTKKTLFALSILFISITTTFGQSRANDLQDLVGAKGSSAEIDMENRGYIHIKTSKSYSDIYSNWWNPRNKKCVSTHISNGRIQSIVNSQPYDCNKSNDGRSISSSSNNNRYNENYSHEKYNNDNFNNSYTSRDSRDYNSHADVHDLMKISATIAYDKLQDRGFVLVKSLQGKTQTYKIWYNNETNQCIKTISINKHIHDVLKSTHCH